jgi:hypothetical protein
MYDHLGGYTTAFLVAGIPPIVGAVLMFLIYRVDGNPTATTVEVMADQNVEAATSNGGMTGSVTKTTFVAEEESSVVEKESLLKV